MKKALSIILAFILALTMALPAFAADNEIKLGEPKQVSVKDGKAVDVSFTPEEDGIYIFKCDYIEDCNMPYYTSDFNYWSYRCIANKGGNIFSMDCIANCFIGEKGRTYTITFGDESDEFYSDGDTTVTFDNGSVFGSLNDGRNSLTIKGDGAVFTFIPENSGYYNFASESDEDVAFTIIDAGELEACNDDNGYKDDYNFDCTAELEAGKTYLVGIDVHRSISIDLDTGEFKFIPEETECDVIITYGKTEKVKKIRIGEFIDQHLFSKDDFGWLDVSIAPSGALATADVKITSSDESVVTIEEYDEEYGEITFSTHNAGRARITVTAGDKTKTYRIKVCNDFEWAFITLLENTFDSVRSIFHDIEDIFLYTINFFYRLFRGYYFR